MLGRVESDTKLAACRRTHSGARVAASIRLHARLRLLVMGFGAAAACLGWLGAGVAQASTAAQITLTLSPNSIVADGVSTTQATATVTDGSGNPVDGDNVTITFGSTQVTAADTGASTGTYTATLQSTTTSGVYTVTATDTSVSPSISNSATLTQTAGPPTTLTVSPPSPSTLPADGYSTATVTARVVDANGNPVTGQPVQFSSSDPGEQVSTAQDNGDGTYTATITSSQTAGTPTITASDTGLTSQTTSLTQTAWVPSSLSFALYAPTLTADGTSTTSGLLQLTDANGHGFPGDAAALRAVANDPAVQLGPVVDLGHGAYSFSITSSTRAHNVVIFVTESTSHLAAGQTLRQVHGPAQNVALQLSPPVLTADGVSTTTATVAVSDAYGNPVAGEAVQIGASAPGLAVGPVTDHGNGLYTATITSSNIPSSLSIVGTDTSTHPAISGEATLTETPAPSLLALAAMQWSFFYSPGYTVVRSLTLSGAPSGATVLITCTGRGCPFRHWSAPLSTLVRCQHAGHRACHGPAGFDLARRLGTRRLHAGTQLVIIVRRPGWIGKYYSFRLRPGKGPRVRITCVAPGSVQPGVGCS